MRKRKRKIIGTIRIAVPCSTANIEQDELYQLMKPIITAVSEYRTSGLEQALENWDKQAPGVLAWGVRSGYFLWVRTNPGKIPTMPQVYAWLQKGGLL